MNNAKLPYHIAIVMDGNGRWAANNGLARAEGHLHGVSAVRKTIEHAIKKNIKTLSLFAFSTENLQRSEDEVNNLFKIYLDVLESDSETLKFQGVKVIFIGDFSKLPDDVYRGLLKLQDMTAMNTTLNLIVGMNYSGKWDIIQATQKIAKEHKDNGKDISGITPSKFQEYLSTYPYLEPDLLIRTSGEKRISNYYLWQLSYTELYFTKVLWPDFDEKEFDLALAEYNNRNRRYGLRHE